MGCSRRVYDLLMLVSILLLCTRSNEAFNITRLLDQRPNYGTFNDLLTKTGVAAGINLRRTITVLVVENSGMSSLTSKATSTVRYILANHVILDYFDELKLGDLRRNKSGTMVTTLLQTTGMAQRNQGFLNVTVSRDGKEVVFGSGVKGAQHDARMVQMVSAQPSNISVIQISQPIVAPGLEGFGNLPPSSSPLSPWDDSDLAPPPKKHKKKKSSEDDDDKSDEGDDDADAPSDDTDDDDGAKSPDADVADGGRDAKEKHKEKNAAAATMLMLPAPAMLPIFLGLLALL